MGRRDERIRPAGMPPPFLLDVRSANVPHCIRPGLAGDLWLCEPKCCRSVHYVLVHQTLPSFIAVHGARMLGLVATRCACVQSFLLWIAFDTIRSVCAHASMHLKTRSMRRIFSKCFTPPVQNVVPAGVHILRLWCCLGVELRYSGVGSGSFSHMFLDP